MDDLLQEFIAETRETLEALAGEIVAWEADPADRTRLDAIFRFVHTVKGSCGFLNMPRLQRLSHSAEDVLGAVRDGTRAADTTLVNAVLAIVDRIGEVVEAIAVGVSLDDSCDDRLVGALAGPAIRPSAQVAATDMTMSPPRPGAVRSIRLTVDLLDRMMSGMSDMVLARNELARSLRDAGGDPRVEAALERLSLTVADMRDTVTRTRMQKVDALFSALPRLVRDTAAELGKAVTLTIDGADVELDREMIELMRDPLVHVIRNAVDHGLETPAERRVAGKRDSGHLAVSARQSGNQILIEISDDGRGIDVDRLIAKAIAVRLRTPAEIAQMTRREQMELIFEPGLSSRDAVTSISGRGVGMDVVRANIEQIGGRVVLHNQPGHGLTLTVHVPLTLSILSTVVIRSGNEHFAVPRQAMEEIVTVRGDAVRVDAIGDAPVATVRGRRLPLVMLGELLRLPGDHTAQTLAIVATREGHYALAVDAVLDTEELVVKPAAPAVMASGFYAGQTLPDSGRPMLLLDIAGLATAAGLRFARTDQREEAAAAGVPEGVAALLFQDLDGERRVIALAAIDRVETVAPGAVRHTAGQLRLTLGDAIVPLHLAAPIGDRDQLAVLRLNDGESEIAYGIAEPIEIVALPAEIAPAAVAGPIAGVAMIAGEQVEVVDVHALFAGITIAAAPRARPLCHLYGDTAGWMAAFLKPTLESAGYRCVTTIGAGESPSVTLAMADDAGVDTASAAPIVRLRRERAGDDDPDDSIYRYDRPALIAAVASRVAGKGRGR